MDDKHLRKIIVDQISFNQQVQRVLLKMVAKIPDVDTDDDFLQQVSGMIDAQKALIEGFHNALDEELRQRGLIK